MTSIERTAYPRFKRYYLPQELHQIYTPNSDDKKFGLANTRGENNYFNLIVLLKVFQRLGYFPSLQEINHQIAEKIRKELSLSKEITIGYNNKRTLYRHRKLIRDYLQIKPFNQVAMTLLSEKVTESALIMDNPADLINVALEELVKEQYGRCVERGRKTAQDV